VKYSIWHICISAYNSKANSLIEHSHRTIWDSLIKTCNSDITQWPTLTHHTFWADHVIMQKSTSHTPFHGTQHRTTPTLWCHWSNIPPSQYSWLAPHKPPHCNMGSSVS
jgi:hypothetical protein